MAKFIGSAAFAQSNNEIVRNVCSNLYRAARNKLGYGCELQFHVNGKNVGIKGVPAAINAKRANIIECHSVKVDGGRIVSACIAAIDTFRVSPDDYVIPEIKFIGWDMYPVDTNSVLAGDRNMRAV